MKKLFPVTVSLCVAGLAFYLIGSNCDVIHYSDGYRDGLVQKLSHKGVLRKSWEGELALPGFNADKNNISNVWHFSIEDERTDIVEELKRIPGNKMVRLHYKELLYRNPFRYGTPYRITKVEFLESKQ